MGSWPPADDDALLAEVGEALREAEQVPRRMVTDALAAFTWRTVDAELAVAELTFDSACDAEPAGLTRSGGGRPRTLAFRAGPVLLEIEVGPAGIVGQVTPACAGRITGRTAQRVYDESPVDPVGCFILGPPPRGPIRLYARTTSYAVATCWVTM